MKIIQKTLTIAFVTFGLAAASLSAAVAAEPATEPRYTPGKKLQRGLYNGFMGWTEAPVTVQKFNKERNWFEALTTGVTRGVGLAFARTGVGIYEVATSPFAAPEKFEPLMMPETVQ